MVELNINRPVYLARRDKFYITSVNELNGHFLDLPVDERCAAIEKTIALFSEVKENTLLAMRGEEYDSKEPHFLRCMELVIDSLRSAQIMVGYEGLLQHDRSFLKDFLGENLGDFDKSEMSARAVAKHIILTTRMVIERVSAKFEKLKQDNYKELSEESKFRYQVMYNRQE